MSFHVPEDLITEEVKEFYESLIVKKDTFFNTPEDPVFYLYLKTELGVTLPLAQWSQIYTKFPNKIRGTPNIKIKCKKTPIDDEVRDQSTVLSQAIKLLDSTGSLFLNLSTGFGKTSLGNMLVGHYKHKTLVVCSKIKVLDQWVEEFEVWSTAKVQKLDQSVRVDPEADVYICSPYHLHKRLADLKYIPMIIYDEMHIETVKVFSLFLRMRPRYLIGLTATKKRTDGFDKAIDVFFGDSVIVRKVKKPESKVYIIDTGIVPEVKTKFFKGRRQVDPVAMASDLAVNPHRNKFISEFILEKMKEGFTTPSEVKSKASKAEWTETWSAILGEKLICKLIFLNGKIRSSGETIYPKDEDTFNIFKLLSPEKVRVLILGMDPYKNENQAHGVAFSIADPKAKTPPTITNIFKELKSDLGIVRENKNLLDWVEQGVMLLNVALTVDSSESGSHLKEWTHIMKEVLQRISELENLKVVVLWGNPAQKFETVFKAKEIIKSAHPSPLSASRGFFGSKPFSKINECLEEEIRW